jgi:glycosyltransferase involved in cell wall biosynthesis
VIVVPSIAVVVPCRNEARHLATLLDAVAAQTRRPDDVIIVDDGSTDGSADVARRWADERHVPVRVIRGPGRGPAGAVNAGIVATTADIIVRLDGHSVPERSYVDCCLKALMGADAATGEHAVPLGVVGGVWNVAPGAGTGMAHAIAAVVSHPIGSGGARYRHPDRAGAGPQVVETVPFGAFRRDVWTQLGGFDESLEVNEDFDFNYRARRAGYAVVLDPAIRATYFARPTVATLARQYFRYGFWKRQMLAKDARAIHWRQIPPVLLVPWLLASGVIGLVWPGLWTAAAAGIYPSLVLAGGTHVAATRRVNPLAAVAAAATVHCSWSAGFWAAVFTRPSARSRARSRTSPPPDR